MAGSSIGESAAIQSPDIDNLTLLLHIAISLILLLRDTLPQLAWVLELPCALKSAETSPR